MNSNELARKLLSEYNIASRVRTPKDHNKAKNEQNDEEDANAKPIHPRTLRQWAKEGLLTYTWRHDGNRGAPWKDFPERAVCEAAALWALKDARMLRGYLPTKEEFDRFLDLVDLAYSTDKRPGPGLRYHDYGNKKQFMAIFAPFDEGTVNASPVLNKSLIAQVVIILEKTKRGWPQRQPANVKFNWRLDLHARVKRMMSIDPGIVVPREDLPKFAKYKDVEVLDPVFVRESIMLEDAPYDQLTFFLLPCNFYDLILNGTTVLTVSRGNITIDYPHPILELLLAPPKKGLHT
jgi:hypothetical protein